ncbi:HpcH/HpaI aldolase/citrate lyase family protein [Streptomyces uncialis]|uniref:HpcH/HpaI aldolase/citrate lyase family protein n=1 Tax=Streptomyces uncialis TaxID=1048205 RepID=UPI0037F405A0
MTRSALYVPGDAPDKLTKALGLGADELLVDLEDSVPPDTKDDARRAVAAWLTGAVPRAAPRIWVRVNPGATGLRDAAGVALPGVAGIVAAKTETTARLTALDRVLGRAEREQGLTPGTFGVIPLVETARALLDARELARGPRVVRLQLGEADLRAETGMDPGPDGRELLYARSRIVYASAAAGIAPPLAPVATDIRDTDALRSSTEALRRLGFQGRACVHPAQIPVVNEVFTPTPGALAAAHEVIIRYENALASGSAVCRDRAGRLIDAAVVRSARRVVALVPGGPRAPGPRGGGPPGTPGSGAP